MKIVHEDGSVEIRPGGTNLNNKLRVDSQPFKLGPQGQPLDPTKHPICGSPKRSGGICHNVAGARTKHKGYGNCWLHSGKLQDFGRGELKWSKLNMESFPGVLERANHLRVMAEKDGIFDLRDHIVLMESIAMTILERAKTMEDLGAALQHIERCTKVIQRLDEIEHGRKLVIDYQGVTLILGKVQAAIERNVRDSFTKDLIARDIAGLLTEGIGGENIPDSEQGAVIEGVAVENRFGAGN